MISFVFYVVWYLFSFSLVKSLEVFFLWTIIKHCFSWFFWGEVFYLIEWDFQSIVLFLHWMLYVWDTLLFHEVTQPWKKYGIFWFWFKFNHIHYMTRMHIVQWQQLCKQLKNIPQQSKISSRYLWFTKIWKRGRLPENQITKTLSTSRIINTKTAAISPNWISIKQS